MRQRVTAILVANSGADVLERTLTALAAQTRAPDVTIAVNVASADGSEALLAAAGPTQLVSVRHGSTFGAAVSHAVQFAPNAESESEWLWLLGHDNAPEPGALEALLGAVEIAPSVAIAGPKLMRAAQPKTIAQFGETLSKFGSSVVLVDGELDQGQHDTLDDVLAVAAGGMLVRRSLWMALGGFDPGLPSIDASLDLCVRARLAGHRVVLVPAARVASAYGPEHFGRSSVSERRRFRLRRAALLHRRLVYAPDWAVALHWLSLVPLAFARSLVDLLAKRPNRIGGEFRAAFSAAFTGNVYSARRKLKAQRAVGWAALAPLRISPSNLRERRAQAREAELAGPLDHDEPSRPVAGFVTNGGFLVVLVVAVLGVLVNARFIGASALIGGGLLPLSSTVAELWAQLGYGWREVGQGMLGAADPFTAVLAVLGSITMWAPSLSIVLLYLSALPLAALGAWFASRNLTRSPWLPALAALLWALAPPLLSAMDDGRLGAMIAHLLLPWLLFSALRARRSVAAGAAAALLLAVVAASVPSLIPALAVLFALLLVTHPGSIHRVIAIPVPMLALFAPLVVQQFLRGNLLGVFADPGVALPGASSTGWRLALADSAGDLHGWSAMLDRFAFPGELGHVLVVALLAPLGVLALLSLFLPGAGKAIPALVMALLGLLTAVAATHLQLSTVGTEPVLVFSGAGISLFWLGLSAAALIGLDALGQATVPSAVLAGLTTTALALPLLVAAATGATLVQPTSGRILPALVTAEASSNPLVGTLVIASEGDAGISASLQRGAGATLDDQSTIARPNGPLDAQSVRVATLAGNLASASGYDAQSDFRELDIRFVIVTPGDELDTTYTRVIQSLSSNELLTPVASTANGLLWRYAADTVPLAERPANTDTTIGRGVLLGLGIVFGVTVLLAIPVGGRWRRPDPVQVLGEDDND